MKIACIRKQEEPKIMEDDISGYFRKKDLSPEIWRCPIGELISLRAGFLAHHRDIFRTPQEGTGGTVVLGPIHPQMMELLRSGHLKRDLERLKKTISRLSMEDYLKITSGRQIEEAWHREGNLAIASWEYGKLSLKTEQEFILSLESGIRYVFQGAVWSREGGMSI